MAKRSLIQENINSLPRSIDPALRAIEFLLQLWPSLDLPPRRISNQNPGNKIRSPAEARVAFLEELSKYTRLLTTLPEYLTRTLRTENVSNESVATLFKKHRQLFNIKKPFDTELKYNTFPLETVLQAQITFFFTELLELVIVYSSINPDRYPPANREAVVAVKTSIGQDLSYLENMLDHNQPCLDFTVRMISSALSSSTRALEVLQRVPEDRHDLTADEQIIYEKLRQQSTLKVHQRVVNALTVFKEIQCQTFQCDATEPSDYVALFQEFLTHYGFYKNRELGTLDLLEFATVSEKLSEVYRAPIREILGREEMKEACCSLKAGGRRRIRKSRRNHKNRRTRKARSSRKN